MIKVGLTGNIAAGKSEVEKIIKSLGYTVFDFDEMTHNLFLDEEIKAKLRREFKTDVRKEISKIAFCDNTKRKFLEELFHPILYKKTDELFKQHKDEKIVVFSGALIYEAGFDKLFDKIIFVDADFMIRLKRLKARNDLDERAAMTRLNIQTTKHKSKADFLILNNDDLDKLRIETESVINSLI